MWFTTNGMCVKNDTIIYVARASNSKRDCDVEALPIVTCERLNMMTSVREERLRASLLLLAATVRSFAHMLFGISDRNKMVFVAVLLAATVRSFTVCCGFPIATHTGSSPYVLVHIVGPLAATVHRKGIIHCSCENAPYPAQAIQ